jgi:hypothetical protein
MAFSHSHQESRNDTQKVIALSLPELGISTRLSRIVGTHFSRNDPKDGLALA